MPARLSSCTSDNTRTEPRGDRGRRPCDQCNMRVYLYLHVTACFLVAPIVSWQYFTPLNAVQLSHNALVRDKTLVHSEYFFGKCGKDNPDRKFYSHLHVNHMKVLGRLVYRAYLSNIERIPTCIVLRGRSTHTYQAWGVQYNFQVCVPRITFIHAGSRFVFYYLEWFIPLDMAAGVDWDFYFYGPHKKKDEIKW